MFEVENSQHVGEIQYTAAHFHHSPTAENAQQALKNIYDLTEIIHKKKKKLKKESSLICNFTDIS